MRKIEEVVLLALVFSTLGYNNTLEAATPPPFTDGEYSISGEYSLTDETILEPNTAITMNGTGDVTFKNNHTDQHVVDTDSTAVIFFNGTNGTDINMHGNDLALVTDFIGIRSSKISSSGVIDIYNVDNFSIEVNSNSTASNAIYLPRADTVKIKANTMQLITTGTPIDRPAIFTNNVDAEVNLEALYDIKVDSAGRGIESDAGNIYVTSTKGNVSIDSTSFTVYALKSNSNITVKAGNDVIIDGAYSLVAQKGGQAAVSSGNNVDITANSIAVGTMTNGIVNMTAGQDINLEANTDDTVWLSSGVADLKAGNSITIKNSSKYDAVYAGNTGELSFHTEKGEISVEGTRNKNAIHADNGKIEMIAEQDITVKGNVARAVSANNGGKIDLTSNTGIIDLTAAKTDASGISNAGIFTSGTTSEVDIHSDAVIQAVEDSVRATSGSVVFDKGLTATAAKGVVTASGGAKVAALDTTSDKKLAGIIMADGSGTSVDMNFATSDAYFTGATAVSNAGAINLAFANDAPWNVTADSSLTKLENNGVVNMRYTGAGKYETVTTDTLSGAGTLKVNTDLQTSKDNLDVTTNSDKLVITGISSGTHTIDVEDTSLLNGKKSEGYVLLVEDKTSGGATFVGGDVAKGGLYKYTPLIISVNPGDNPDILDTYSNVPTGNVKNWYLAGYEKSGELQPVVAPLLGASDNRYAAYRFEQDNLLLRLGELRDNENSQGIWARVKTAKETVNDTTDSRFTMYQVGYDKKYKDDESGRKYFGVAFNHTKGDQDYSSTSNGESSSNAMTLYNTWLGNKGHYLDLVGKVGKISGDWNYSNARFPDSGDSSAWFYSLSGEYGRKIMNKDGFYTEPQAQLTYGHINGAGYTSDSGINVDQDSINSLIGRVGFTIGKHFNGDEDGKRTNAYAKLFYNHEFLGDSDVRMNDTYGDTYSHSGDFGGSWWTAGVGVTAQLDKKTNAYFDVQKTFGGDIDQKWQFNVGLRWNWGGAK